MEKYVPKPGDTIVNGRRMLVIETNGGGFCYVAPYNRSYFTGKWDRCVPDIRNHPHPSMSESEVSALVNHMGWKVL